MQNLQNEKGEHIKNIIDDMREKKYTVYQINTNNSNDFLFVKDDNLINTLHKFTEPGM